MTKRKLFIAYHGTYDQNGSLKKAEKIYDYLREHGVDCFLFSAHAGTNNTAFMNTPIIASESEKFLLVCNENIHMDAEGRVTNHGILQEIDGFHTRYYDNESSKGDARVYGFGEMDSKKAAKLHFIFRGSAHFTEVHRSEEECLKELLEWVQNASAAMNNDTAILEASLDDLRLTSEKLSRNSEYGLSRQWFTEKLLPGLEFDGGRKLANILELEPEEKRTYVIYANGGSGKSCSIKRLWTQYLHTEWIPLYVSVRSCYEQFGDTEHPLYEYLRHTYKNFAADSPDLSEYFQNVKEKWMVLLDGFNEAENTDRIRADANAIDEYVTTVITTRDKKSVAGLDANNILYVRMKPLEEKVVRDYIENYGHGELRGLLSDENMLVLLRNPMLLTMFCHSFDAEGYNFRMEISQASLTPGELIEKCVTAQLRKTNSVHLDTFFAVMCLFPMAIAELYYTDRLFNMTVNRIDLMKAVMSVLKGMDIDSLEAFYLLEYADKWGLDVNADEMDELFKFLHDPKPLEIRNQMASFEEILSGVLQFFHPDTERSRVGGGLYRFEHQTSLNWYISYGIYRMADLWTDRFREILEVLTENIGLVSDDTDDFEEQGEFIFDLIRNSSREEAYRLFIKKLHTRHFALKTPRVYDIATGGISLYDKLKVSDEDYANDVATFCYSLYSLDKNTPSGVNEDEVLEIYGNKLRDVWKKAEKIKDEEFRRVTMAKIDTIEGALRLGKHRLYKNRHKDKDPETVRQLRSFASEAEEFQMKALKTRQDVLEHGSGRFRNEMRFRIAYSYTSLGTARFHLADYDKSIAYHQLAWELREALAEDEEMDEEYRDDSRLRMSININRINGSLLMRGNVTPEVLEEIFRREEYLARENRIEAEMKNQVKNFEKEIALIGSDRKLLERAKEVYAKISEAFARMFGYQSDQLKTIGESLDKKSSEIREEEIRMAQFGIDRFFASEPFQNIVKLFNDGNGTTDPEEIDQIAEQWDYRRKLAAGGERQAITEEDVFVKPHSDELIAWIRELGMIEEKTELYPAPDYVLPLGGYGQSNLRRCQVAKKTCDRYPYKEILVCALSSQRKIDKQAEFDAIRDFAPEAKTEFEEMDYAMRIAYDLEPAVKHDTYNEPDTKEYWAAYTYASKEENRTYYNLSAPCYEKTRARASTLDTFVHFLKCFDVPKGSRVFLLSTSLYEPYQYYSLLPEAIEYGVKLYFVGGEYKGYEGRLLATLCLQDLKSAVDAMCKFLQKYPKNVENVQ